jgi:hypothetical protein
VFFLNNGVDLRVFYFAVFVAGLSKQQAMDILKKSIAEVNGSIN